MSSKRRSRAGTPAIHDYGTGRSSTARSSARPTPHREARRSKSRDSNRSSERAFGRELRNSNSLPDVNSSRGSGREGAAKSGRHKHQRPRPGRQSRQELDIFKADPRRGHEVRDRWGLWAVFATVCLS